MFRTPSTITNRTGFAEYGQATTIRNERVNKPAFANPKITWGGPLSLPRVLKTEGGAQGVPQFVRELPFCVVFFFVLDGLFLTFQGCFVQVLAFKKCTVAFFWFQKLHFL